ncbi:hypothetical protein ACTVH1_17935 [Gluconobacter cerinus]
MMIDLIHNNNTLSLVHDEPELDAVAVLTVSRVTGAISLLDRNREKLPKTLPDIHPQIRSRIVSGTRGVIVRMSGMSIAKTGPIMIDIMN